MSYINGKYSLGMTYTHVQQDYSSIWIVNHNLGFSPNVQVYVLRDGKAYERILPKEVEIVDNNQVKVTFSISVIGKVILT